MNKMGKKMRGSSSSSSSSSSTPCACTRVIPIIRYAARYNVWLMCLAHSSEATKISSSYHFNGVLVDAIFIQCIAYARYDRIKANDDDGVTFVIYRMHVPKYNNERKKFFSLR